MGVVAQVKKVVFINNINKGNWWADPMMYARRPRKQGDRKSKIKLNVPKNRGLKKLKYEKKCHQQRSNEQKREQ